MEALVEDCNFVRTTVWRFVGEAMRMHKVKDESVRQLCGLGIVPVLQDHTKMVPILVQRAPSRVEKKVVRQIPSIYGKG
jgi:hypothetical protein